MASSCERGIEPLGSVKAGHFSELSTFHGRLYVMQLISIGKITCGSALYLVLWQFIFILNRCVPKAVSYEKWQRMRLEEDSTPNWNTAFHPCFQKCLFSLARHYTHLFLSWSPWKSKSRECRLGNAAPWIFWRRQGTQIILLLIIRRAVTVCGGREGRRGEETERFLFPYVWPSSPLIKFSLLNKPEKLKKAGRKPFFLDSVLLKKVSRGNIKG